MSSNGPRHTIDVTGLAARGGVSSQAVEAELTRYVEEKQINDLFINITERMLMVKPDNPVQFIVDYLREKYPDQVAHPSGGFDGTTEAEYAHGAEAEDEESDNDDDEDYVDELPAFDSARKATRRRTAVSAEAGVDPTTLAAMLAEKRHEKSAEDEARLQSFLEKNLLFSHLDATQMKILIGAFHPRAFSAGETLIRQGEEGDVFYLLDKGTAEVFVNRTLADKIAMSGGAAPAVATDDAVGDKVLTVREGETFGELALMYNAPRAATVKAATDLATWTLDRVAFKAILVHTANARHERNFDFVTRIPMLSELTEQERRVIADALQPERYKAGAVIVQQGEPGHKFFIMEEGEVVVQKRLTAAHPPQKLLTLDAGRYFGEIALLTSKPRQASVTATEDSACLVLDRKTFNRVMGPLTDILQRNMDKYEMVMSQQL